MPNYKNLPAQSKHFQGQLYQRMLDDFHLAGMSERTIYGYIRAVRQLVAKHMGWTYLLRSILQPVVVESPSQHVDNVVASLSCCGSLGSAARRFGAGLCLIAWRHEGLHEFEPSAQPWGKNWKLSKRFEHLENAGDEGLRQRR